ncbi:MAG: hypothetical protein SFV19_19515 [Rhodospirillaceae bacterium]|nr:hypothetical protein [Rhodospirillaceae bacterium]
MIASALAAPAGAAQPCASSQEADAIYVRHLQSRLVVAALSCGQQEAYNAFVTRHKADLGLHGPKLIAYFQRAGGAKALNSFVTELANAAAAIRAANPEAFCNQTWTMFWSLQQRPDDLRTLAPSQIIPGVTQPAVCPPPGATGSAPTQTAAPKTGAAAR